MKRKFEILVLTMAILSNIGVTEAQEKYAVLITGDYAAKGIPLENQWKNGIGDNSEPKVEFWYDTYLMWEMLVYEKGFTDENVFVIFADGQDYITTEMWGRYKAVSHQLDHITDYSATRSNVEDVFNGLATGTNGFPLVTVDDFLFVWTFDHGGWDSLSSIPYSVYFLLLPQNLNGDPDYMYDTEFADLVNPIKANKKVFWMQQYSSGGFWQDLYAENVIFHSACRYDEKAYPCDNFKLNGVSVIEMEEISGLIYVHGEYDFHNYSCMVGFSPSYINNYGGELYTDADTNGDSYISIFETYEWERTHESIDLYVYPEWGETPEIIDDSNLGLYTSFEYPTLLWGNNLCSGIYRGLIGLSKDIHITNGKQITFAENALVVFLNNANLYIDAGASLIINNNVNFKATKGIKRIIVNGNVSIGSNVTFIAENDAQIWLELNNTNQNLYIDNPEFYNGVIISYADALTLFNPTINQGGLYGFKGNYNIISGQFNNSFATFNQASNNNRLISFNACTFTFKNTTAINIDNYPNFRIDNCNINGFTDGIKIYNSGYGTGFQLISNNEIQNNSACGITIYRSSVDVMHNSIYGNGYGLKCLDRSTTHIEGNHQIVTQEIRDNRWNEVYATRGGFPQYMHWNLIKDDDNLPGDPMVKYTGTEGNLDVTYNCWGTNFNALVDLEPVVQYIWDPVWLCNTTGGSGSGSTAEMLYLDARENLESENYVAAKSNFEQIIDEYPESEFAKAAMKELFAIEEFTSDNYTSLKDYYNTNDSIQADSSLSRLADFLANFCDIKLENWQTAIAWFEDVIQAPESFEDSIFAIIDLGYTYWLMENSGLKSSYTGAMPQYKFGSQKDYEENRDYLLSLLPGDGLSETMKQSLSTLKTGELLQNVPNPFNGTTQIWFKLAEESSVSIAIYDYTGKEVSKINPGTLKTGNHSVEFNSANLPSGIYLYSLEVNGIKTDTKKMTLVR